MSGIFFFCLRCQKWRKKVKGDFFLSDLPNLPDLGLVKQDLPDLPDLPAIFPKTDFNLSKLIKLDLRLCFKCVNDIKRILGLKVTEENAGNPQL